MKLCLWCGNELPLSAFAKMGKGKLRPECKECRKKRAAGYGPPREIGGVMVQEACGVKQQPDNPNFTPQERANWNKNFKELRERLKARWLAERGTRVAS